MLHAVVCVCVWSSLCDVEAHPMADLGFREEGTK